ncbi:MAG: TIGR02466 family protein [Pseudomonadota bacterium]
MIEMREYQYFPTQVFSHQLPDDQAKSMNTALTQAIYAEREADLEGTKRSNFKELGGWHSQNNLHKKDQYKPVTDLIAECCVAVSQSNHYKEDRKLTIGTMWSIINPPGSFNRAHIHPGSLWSGVYYVQAPENAGKIEFIDPRAAASMLNPVYSTKPKRPKKTLSRIKFIPTAGRILIFPSWLYHAVEPNLTEAKGDAANRIIISFNLNQTRG